MAMEEPAPLVNCLYCHDQIQEADIKAEMPCHHFLHTACFLPFTRAPGFNHIDECQACQNMFTVHYPDDDGDTIGTHQGAQVTRRDEIRNLYETNEAFRKKAKDLVKQKTVTAKAQTEIKRVIQEKKGEIRNQLLLLKAQLEGLLEGKKDEVRSSPEYKEFVKAKRRYNGLETNLRTIHNCSARDIQKYLNDKPGFRRFDAWRFYYCSYSSMRRPWSFRVPV